MVGGDLMEHALPTQAAAIRDFHALLLPGTLESARRTPFYRELWASTDMSEPSLAVLEQLPVVDKTMVREAGARAQVRRGLVCNEVFTSGTTGVPLVTVRGDREQRSIRDFSLRVLADHGGRPLLRGLQINNPYHGYEVGVPSPVHFHRISIYDAQSFAHGRRVIGATHQDEGVEERCTIVVGLERCLRAFARYLADDGLPPEASLARVVSYSQYLTGPWRAEFEEVFGCGVTDRYSLTEVFGGATECGTCHWWHPDPVVVAEVIGWSSGQVLREGVGVLLLTALYPFQEAQPMVRYSTGDLVRVTHERSCRPGVPSIQPLGRARYGVRQPGTDTCLVTPVSVLEAVDVRPEVARTPRFRDAAQVADPWAVGHPKYRLAQRETGGVVEILVELEFGASVHAARRRAVEETVAAEIEAANPPLATAMTRREAGLRVAGVDRLEPDLISHAE